MFIYIAIFFCGLVCGLIVTCAMAASGDNHEAEFLRQQNNSLSNHVTTLQGQIEQIKNFLQE